MANLYYKTHRIVNKTNMDLDDKVYAKIIPTEPLSFDELINYMTDHRHGIDRCTVLGVMYAMVDCMKELLCEGRRFWLGDLGVLYTSLKCKAADDEESFNPGNIVGIRLKFKQNASPTAKLSPKILRKDTKLRRK